eukprot:m.246017 g.246017  ORF g.246017 m.246017 type:complete len:1131 (+) comp16112_c0_seq1:109-3501(+)
MSDLEAILMDLDVDCFDPTTPLDVDADVDVACLETTPLSAEATACLGASPLSSDGWDENDALSQQTGVNSEGEDANSCVDCSDKNPTDSNGPRQGINDMQYVQAPLGRSGFETTMREKERYQASKTGRTQGYHEGMSKIHTTFRGLGDALHMKQHPESTKPTVNLACVVCGIALDTTQPKGRKTMMGLDWAICNESKGQKCGMLSNRVTYKNQPSKPRPNGETCISGQPGKMCAWECIKDCSVCKRAIYVYVTRELEWTWQYLGEVEWEAIGGDLSRKIEENFTSIINDDYTQRLSAAKKKARGVREFQCDQKKWKLLFGKEPKIVDHAGLEWHVRRIKECYCGTLVDNLQDVLNHIPVCQHLCHHFQTEPEHSPTKRKREKKPAIEDELPVLKDMLSSLTVKQKKTLGQSLKDNDVDTFFEDLKTLAEGGVSVNLKKFTDGSINVNFEIILNTKGKVISLATAKWMWEQIKFYGNENLDTVQAEDSAKLEVDSFVLSEQIAMDDMKRDASLHVTKINDCHAKLNNREHKAIVSRIDLVTLAREWQTKAIQRALKHLVKARSRVDESDNSGQDLDGPSPQRKVQGEASETQPEVSSSSSSDARKMFNKPANETTENTSSVPTSKTAVTEDLPVQRKKQPLVIGNSKASRNMWFGYMSMLVLVLFMARYITPTLPTETALSDHTYSINDELNDTELNDTDWDDYHLEAFDSVAPEGKSLMETSMLVNTVSFIVTMCYNNLPLLNLWSILLTALLLSILGGFFTFDKENSCLQLHLLGIGRLNISLQLEQKPEEPDPWKWNEQDSSGNSVVIDWKHVGEWNRCSFLTLGSSWQMEGPLSQQLLKLMKPPNLNGREALYESLLSKVKEVVLFKSKQKEQCFEDRLLSLKQRYHSIKSESDSEEITANDHRHPWRPDWSAQYWENNPTWTSHNLDCDGVSIPVEDSKHPANQSWMRSKERDHAQKTIYRLRERYTNIAKTIKDPNPGYQVLTVYHGLANGDLGLAKQICSTGFGTFAQRNSGWFGSGVYFTPDLDYAVAFAKTAKKAKTEPIVIVCNILVFQPYPLTSIVVGCPVRAKSDCHVAVVRHADDLTNTPTTPLPPDEWEDYEGGTKMSTEICMVDLQHVLPRAILRF